MRPLPEWTIPAGFLAAFVLIAVALWAVGNGASPNDYPSEVESAKYLLTEIQQRETIIDNAVNDEFEAPQRRRECEEGYLGSVDCEGMATSETELNSLAIKAAVSQIDELEATLRSLDPAAVREAEQ